MVIEIDRRFCACSAKVIEIPTKIDDFQKFYLEEFELGRPVIEIHLIF